MSNDNHDNVGDTTQAGEPKYATVEDITNVVSEMLNKALTNRNKQVEAKLEKAIVDIQTKFQEQLSALTQTSQTTDKTKTAEVDYESTPAYRGMQKQIAELQKQAEEAKLASLAVQKQNREVRLRQKVGEELIKVGVDPSRVKHAVTFLLDGEKRVKYADEESDDIVFNDNDTEIDLQTGLKSWAKTDDAKIYQPARGTTGSGDPPRGKKQPSSNPSNNRDALEGLISQAFAEGKL